MSGKTNTIKRAGAAIALTAALTAVAVPSAWANGNDGDRATSKAAVVVNPNDMGSLGDRATSQPAIVNPDGIGSLGDRATSQPAILNPDGIGSLGDRGTSKPLGGGTLAVPVVSVVSSSGFDLEAFGVGAVAMLAVITLLAAAGTGLRAARRHGLYGT